MILVTGVIRMSVHSLTREVGIGSRSHDLVGENVILRYRLQRRKGAVVNT